MEPTKRNFEIFMLPTAICTRNPLRNDYDKSGGHWNDSPLNPKNRINSLTPNPVSRWRIDGGSHTGAHYFVIPSFAQGKTPLRIDAHIATREIQLEYLNEVLKPESSTYLDSSQVVTSALAQYVIKTLDAWSEAYGWAELEAEYMRMPFGSRISITNISISLHETKVDLVPYYAIEQQMLPLSALQAMWRLSPYEWPHVQDIHELRFLRQLHKSISLVQIWGMDTKLWVFKSSTDDLKPLYHELKTLLTIPPHPNIISRPSYIITKRCGFGGKIGVCGFLLQYHDYGTLSMTISDRARQGRLGSKDQLRWASQITSALIHLNETTNGLGYYTNLKPENVVMVRSSKDFNVFNAVLIDFEQRLSIPCWNAPEINFISQLVTLATSSSVLSMRQKYTSILESANLFSNNTTRPTMKRYDNPVNGPCHPWPTLSLAQRERTGVLLGKLLWYIFENGILPSTTIGIHSFKYDIPDIVFPAFKNTPEETLRELIRRCTNGAAEWRRRIQPLVRRGKMIGLTGGTGEESVEDVQVAVRKWWREEVGDAERFVNAMITGTLDKDERWREFQERPSLREVLTTLETLASET